MMFGPLLCLGFSLSFVSAAPLGNALSIAIPKISKRWSTSNAFPVTLASFEVESANDTKTYYSPLESWSTTFNTSISDVDGYYPVTVFKVGGTVSCSSLSTLVTTYTEKDDVFDEVFLGGIILASSSPITTSGALEACFPGASFVVSSGGGGYGAYLSGTTPPPGPYLAKVSSSSVTLYRVWRAYQDEQQAFTGAIVPIESTGGFAPISVNVAGMNTLAIGVPSRLYYTATADKPLAGARVGIKDIFDIQGVKTGDGNRAYWEFYPPRNVTSTVVQTLVDAGAIIIGKTKASQFANGETATADWVDQMCPFNPRGDGYQDPSSSSSGSGASMGAYDWLDYAIGSDTGGSIRGPAGVYGIRPSFDAISLANVMPLAVTMDTAGGFARDAESFSLFHKTLYAANPNFKNYSSFPKKIYVPTDEFPVDNNASQPLFAAFVESLAGFLNATVDNTTVAQAWNASSYAQYGDIDTYLNLTYPTLIAYYQYTNFSGPWIRDYQSVNDGRVPFIDPVPLARWQFGISQGPTGYAAALQEQSNFKTFMNDIYLGANNESCSDSIYLYAQSTGDPSPRNVYFNAPTYPYGYSSGRIGPFAGTPDAVLPIGQVPYNSTITNHTEVLPITMSFVLRENCDYVTLDLFSALEKAGITKGVMVGTTAF